MLRWALIFLVLALVAGALGAGGVAGLSMNIAYVLFVVFLILLVGVMGFEFLTATTLAKVANLTTNLAAIASFGLSGNILWGLGIIMGVGNVAGGMAGSHMALRNGNAFVRKVFLVVVLALGLKLAWDTVALFV